MISGRYPNLGPEVLTGAGVPVLDRVEGTDAIEDGATVRVHDEVVYVGETPVAMGREVDGRVIEEEMADARLGLVTQLETFTHNSAEFLRREQDLLLHGLGPADDRHPDRGPARGRRRPRPRAPRRAGLDQGVPP